MTRAAGPDAVLICCSALAAEVRAVVAERWPGATVHVQNSMLHMRPEALGSRVSSAVDAEEGRRVLLVYGDCAAALADLERRPGVARTGAKNCCELLVGPAEYRRLSREGAFFLLPEWAVRWREVFAEELGLTRDNAVDLMRDMHRRLVYLDTGVAPVPTDELRACADYCGLPLEIRPTSLAPLREALEEGVRRLERPEAPR